MRVLMISGDRTLLAGGLGDVVVRHQEYAKDVERLDILVFTRKKIIQPAFLLAPNSLVERLGFGNMFSLPKKYHAKYHYDLVVCQDPFFTGFAGWWLKRKSKIKLLVHFHGDFWRNRWWLRERWCHVILSGLAKFVVKKADAIRVMSQGQKDKLLCDGIDEKKIRVISTPVDIERFEKYPDEKLENRELIEKLRTMTAHRKMILMVGRKDKVKDFPNLFAAMNLVHDKFENCGLWLVGNYLAGEANGLGLSKSVPTFVSGQVSAIDIPPVSYTNLT
ncbi:hypothetical protein D4R52_02355, partial [bacterium]